jgi:3-oxoacyl-[acyl-carrier protein] reductase
MNLGIAGRVAIISGGSKGIGRCTGLTLAEEGCYIAFSGRSLESLEKTRREFEAAFGKEVPAFKPQPDLPLAFPFQGDMNNPTNVTRFVEQVHATYGRIDIAVNNVGGSFGGGGFAQSSEDQWRKVFEINLFASYNLSKAVVPYMQAHNWGRIINVGSVWGREGGGGSAYNAAKAAEISLAKSMATDLARYGILVNSVAPGSTIFPGGSWARKVESDPEGMEEFVKQEMPLGRFGTPEEVANVIAFLASERASLVTGACWSVDGSQGRSNI